MTGVGFAIRQRTRTLFAFGGTRPRARKAAENAEKAGLVPTSWGPWPPSAEPLRSRFYVECELGFNAAAEGDRGPMARFVAIRCHTHSDVAVGKRCSRRRHGRGRLDRRSSRRPASGMPTIWVSLNRLVRIEDLDFNPSRGTSRTFVGSTPSWAAAIGLSDALSVRGDKNQETIRERPEHVLREGGKARRSTLSIAMRRWIDGPPEDSTPAARHDLGDPRRVVEADRTDPPGVLAQEAHRPTTCALADDAQRDHLPDPERLPVGPTPRAIRPQEYRPRLVPAVGGRGCP
jgi:hypothetical protein